MQEHSAAPISLHVAHGELSEREQTILSAIIQSYILSATPVGSQTLAATLAGIVKLSPATVRNVMSDLETMGYIMHPHTSAGRIPTDKGYRLYVDSLLHHATAALAPQVEVEQNLAGTIAMQGTETALREASKLLGSLSQLLAVVQIPSVLDLVVRRIELVALSSTRLLVVIDFNSDVVRTLTMEAGFEIDHASLDGIARAVNERIAGRQLRYIREHFADMMRSSSAQPVVRLFIDSVDSLFAATTAGRLHVAGVQHLLQQPEFTTPESMRGVVELIENEDVIIHVLDGADDGISVRIGSELNDSFLNDYSLVAARYTVGTAVCAVGLIGPKRMNYAKMMSLVGTVANSLSTGKA